MTPNIPDGRVHNRSWNLAPQPERRTPSTILLDQIPDQNRIDPTPLQYRRRQRGRLTAHASPPLSSGTPDHILTNVRCASRTSRSPFAVTRKYRFARPPRSAVGSPSFEAMSPRPSNLSNA